MISMITNRGDLYQRIWEDYSPLPSDKKQDSFFYKYLKNKKDLAAQRIAKSADSLAEYCTRKKRDKYIMLRSAYLAYSNSVISEAEYIRLFNSLFSEKQRRKYVPLTPENIDKAEQIYEREFLLGCINDFFYNLGYRVRKNEAKSIEIGEIGYVKTDERYLKEKDGYIDDLDLWSNYYVNFMTGESQLPQFISGLNDEYIDKCKQVFDVLNREERTKSFLPLYFDVTSGAGVMVIGNEMLPIKKRTEKACRICIMYFSELYEGISDFNDIDLTMTTVPELYDDVGTAFQQFRQEIAQFVYTENYRDQNDKPPLGLDSIFNCFFIEKLKKPTASDKIIKIRSQEEKTRFSKWQKEQEEKNKIKERMDRTKK